MEAVKLAIKALTETVEAGSKNIEVTPPPPPPEAQPTFNWDWIADNTCCVTMTQLTCTSGGWQSHLGVKWGACKGDIHQSVFGGDGARGHGAGGGVKCWAHSQYSMHATHSLVDFVSHPQ